MHPPAPITRRACAFLPVAAALLLAGCATTRYKPVSDLPIKVGRPYTVRGTTYVPAVDPAYDAVGYASWYGTESGNQTANGERFSAKAINGAHTTLPLPSYVEVTALATGRTILVRVNDRGPFARGRIIDLTEGAAALLGIKAQGTAAVHLRVVDPPDRDKALLRAGRAAAPRRAVPPALLDQWRARLALGPSIYR